jgi:uncharacterized protein (TIGR02145 family)
MKNIITLILIILTISSLVGQVPNQFKYQALLRDSDGIVLKNENVDFKISIRKEGITGEIVFTEIHNLTTSNDGIVNLNIGSIEDLSIINWHESNYFIEIKVDDILMGISQLLSVPYALHSKTADSISSSFTENDPIFNSSIASRITNNDISNWDNKLDSLIEEDPLFNSSIAKDITQSDTSNWNSKLDNYLEVDPIFDISIAKGITALDTIIWNNKLDSYIEIDGDIRNEIQTISKDGLTVTLSNGGGSFQDSVFSLSAGAGLNIIDNVISVNGTGGHYIGELYEGGIVFFVYNNGKRGLILSLEEMNGSNGSIWGVASTDLIGCESSWNGYQNTSDLIDLGISNFPAANSCVNYDGGGYLDWYLPSIWELQLLYNSLFLINKVLEKDGNEKSLGIELNQELWSSTESPIGNAYYLDVSKGITDIGNQNLNKKIRAVRALDNYFMDTSLIGTLTDYDGNVYNTVIIGNQEWMQENLKVTHYADGTELIYIEDAIEWADLNYGNPLKAFCYYNNNINGEAEIYGAMYTATAAMNGLDTSNTNPSGLQGVCPDGWHIPSDTEWSELTDYLGGNMYAGGKLKEAGTDHWNEPNTGATNETSFTGLPGGLRFGSEGQFDHIGNWGYWHSSTWGSPSTNHHHGMGYNNIVVAKTGLGRDTGASVRCVKD